MGDGASVLATHTNHQVTAARLRETSVKVPPSATRLGGVPGCLPGRQPPRRRLFRRPGSRPQSQASLRRVRIIQLAALSLSLRIEAPTQGAYPERLSADDAKAVDPPVGAHPTYTRTASGGAYLAHQRAAAAYSELGLWRVPPPLEWALPGPAAPTPKVV